MKQKLTLETFRKEISRAITRIQMKYALKGLVFIIEWNWHKIGERK